MCKETFLRLPEEKRNRFLDAAWGEFTTVRFTDASINRIIKQAGIPRGSFYQYFESKDDLFQYLLKQTGSHFFHGYLEILQQAGGDLFRAQLLSFDQFGICQLDPSTPMYRCREIMRVNPGMDLEKFMASPSQPCGRLFSHLDALKSHLDLSIFRQQDDAFISQILQVSMFLLASAIMGVLTHPDWGAEVCRANLESQLRLLQYGCLKDSPPAA